MRTGAIWIWIVDSQSQPQSMAMQLSPQVCNGNGNSDSQTQQNNSNTINSNASNSSIVERTSVRNLFIRNIERMDSSGSVVRVPLELSASSSYGEGGGKEENGEYEYFGGGTDKIIDIIDCSKPQLLMPYQQRKRLSLRKDEAEGGSQRQQTDVSLFDPSERILTTCTPKLAPANLSSPVERIPTPFPSNVNAVHALPSQEYGISAVVGVVGDVNTYKINPTLPLTMMDDLKGGQQQQIQALHLPASPSRSPSPPSPPSQHQCEPPISSSV